MFNQVDKAWKDIMRKVQDRPNAMKCATATGTLETLQSCNVSLEKIQKCLEVGIKMLDHGKQTVLLDRLLVASAESVQNV